ncbi:MAG: molecular chaperone HtpG, partial [Spirochaetota bacterium]
GFYSVFMVADRVEVLSRKAGEEKAYKWTSDGKGNYEIMETERDQFGTTVILHLNESGLEFANKWSIEGIIKKYSNHIPFPIYLHYQEDKEGKGKKEAKVEQANAASALWRKPKSELKEEDYHEFYKSISHDTQDPLMYIHTQAEGKLEYTTLFYIPQKAPIDLFWADYQPGVKLYIKRVSITDDEKELLPHYLRFVRGIIDSEDLPLNISRETLQQNRVIASIRNASVKKILSELQELRKNDRQKYDQFYQEFRLPLKEGLYHDFNNRDTLLELVQSKSTKAEGYTSLSEYKQRMQPDQKSIYYITGADEQDLRSSPLLEAYKRRDIEVLIMDDEIDEIVVPAVGTFQDISLKSVNRADAAEDLKTIQDTEGEKKIEPVVKKIKQVLGDEVKDVRASTRLSDSPSCIVADEKDPTLQMQNMLKAMGQKNIPEAKPILEINPDHIIVKSLQGTSNTEVIEDVSRLLLEQALLVEGAQLKDKPGFVKRLNRALAKSLMGSG